MSIHLLALLCALLPVTPAFAGPSVSTGTDGARADMLDSGARPLERSFMENASFEEVDQGSDHGYNSRTGRVYGDESDVNPETSRLYQ